MKNPDWIPIFSESNTLNVGGVLAKPVEEHRALKNIKVIYNPINSPSRFLFQGNRKGSLSLISAVPTHAFLFKETLRGLSLTFVLAHERIVRDDKRRGV